MAAIRDPELGVAAAEAVRAVERAQRWLEEASENGRGIAEAGARRFALTLGRCLGLALLARHAQWSLDHERDGLARAAARRFAATGLEALTEADRFPFPGVRGAGEARVEALAEARALAGDRELAAAAAEPAR